MPGGRPRTKPLARCPKPEHRGSTTQASGTYTTQSGRRQRYRCLPLTGKAHFFTVVLEERAKAQPRFGEAAPACPQGHTGKVYRNGVYGSRPAEQRQSYRCTPAPTDLGDDGEPAKRHKFTLDLPRDHVHVGNQDCKACEELRGIHRGETAIARRHSWSTRVVVRALERLAAGETYTSVSQWALRVEGSGKRTRKTPKQVALERAAKAAKEEAEANAEVAPAGPLPKAEPATADDPKAEAEAETGTQTGTGDDEEAAVRVPRPGERWHIAADWCETFSPVIWADEVERATAAATAAREAGDLIVWLVDSTSFAGTRREEGGRNGGATSERFALLSIAEQFVTPGQPPKPPKLRLVRAMPTRTTQAWQLVLAEPGYAPDLIVTDADAAQLNAIVAQFSQVVIIPCLYHLRRSLEDGLADLPGAFTGAKNKRRLEPDLRAHLNKMTGRDDIQDRAQIAAWWDDWAALHVRLDIPLDRLVNQRSRYEPVMAAASVDLVSTPELPMSVGALEAMENTVIRPSFERRSAGFANIERTNALLDLIVAGQRHAFDDPNRIADLLRKDATGTDADDNSHGGFTTPLRWVEDPQPPKARYSSLHDATLVLDLAERRGIL